MQKKKQNTALEKSNPAKAFGRTSAESTPCVRSVDDVQLSDFPGKQTHLLQGTVNVKQHEAPPELRIQIQTEARKECSSTVS